MLPPAAGSIRVPVAFCTFRATASPSRLAAPPAWYVRLSSV